MKLAVEEIDDSNTTIFSFKLMDIYTGCIPMLITKALISYTGLL